MSVFKYAMFFVLSTLLLPGCVTAAEEQNADTWPLYNLVTQQVWRLDAPRSGPFQASGLLLTPKGNLLTLSDDGPAIYEVQFPTGSASATLKPLTNLFARLALGRFVPYQGHYDSEGIAQDDQGRVYICEENNRWIMRCNPVTGYVEQLPIDWKPVQHLFSKSDRNASFEGVAIGDGKLYVANERSEPAIIVVDLQTLKVLEQFVVSPRTSSLLGLLHYSDLSWFQGKLYVLCRHHRVVLEVDPKTHAVLAEFNYKALEDALAYTTRYPTGLMEGLAVDQGFIWLVTDNNGLGHAQEPADIRPTLVKCRRPDRK